MANTVTLTQSTYKELLNRLSRLEKMVISLLEKFDQEPPSGTDAWWEWAIKKGKEDIKKGQYVEITTKKQRDAVLKSL